MKHAEIAKLTNREYETTFNWMIVTIQVSVSDLASVDDGENGEDDDNEETEQGKLRTHDEHGWVMGIMTKTVQQRMERLWQKWIKLDELTQPRWEDAADCFRARDQKNNTSEFRVAAVIPLQTDDDAAVPALTPLGLHMECHDIIHRIL